MPIVNIGKANEVHMYNGPVNISYYTDEHGNTRVVREALAADGASTNSASTVSHQTSQREGAYATLPTPTAVDGAGDGNHGSSGLTESGRVLCGPSDGGNDSAGAGVPVQCTELYGESSGARSFAEAGGGSDLQDDSEQQNQQGNQLPAGQFDPSRVYPMNTTPRGKILIINNKKFSWLGIRVGTERDRDTLKDLFKKTLGFAVQVVDDCTTEKMLQTLRNFAQDSELYRVSACVVAILSHGGKGDIIYGCDGRVQGGMPVQGTYMHKDDLRTIFSSIACPAMKDKPKLFIVQACRGDLEDTAHGPRLLRDGPSPECPTDRPNIADQYFMFASVANYVAYRNWFVKLLAKVFKEHAKHYHVKDLATELNHEMSKLRLGAEDEHVFSIGEDSGTLTKHFFFNPPALSSSSPHHL